MQIDIERVRNYVHQKTGIVALYYRVKLAVDDMMMSDDLPFSVSLLVLLGIPLAEEFADLVYMNNAVATKTTPVIKIVGESIRPFCIVKKERISYREFPDKNMEYHDGAFQPTFIRIQGPK